MKWDDIQDIPCSVARALSVVGDRWTLLIIRDCFLGTKRFDQFQKRIGVPRPRLTERLNKLVEHEILRKVPYQEKPVRYEYKLSRKGVDLYPVIMTLVKWGDTWMAGEDGPPVEYMHTKCGSKMSAELSCSECGETLDPREITPLIGPGLKAHNERMASNEK